MPHKRILVQGHRGARGIRPENSLEAFAYAMEAGADGVELDLAVTADDVLVISHDPVLADGTVIRESRAADLLDRVPLLDQVFRLTADSRIELNLEVKSYPDAPQYTPRPETFVALLLDRIAAFGMADRVMVESFDFRILEAIKVQAPGIRRGALYEAEPRYIPPVHFLAPHYSLVTPDGVRAAHQAGMQVIPWTVNAPSDWERMAAASVDAIITDDPASLLAWLSARGLR